jgi:hypothetical protein
LSRLGFLRGNKERGAILYGESLTLHGQTLLDGSQPSRTKKKDEEDESFKTENSHQAIGWDVDKIEDLEGYPALYDILVVWIFEN